LIKTTDTAEGVSFAVKVHPRGKRDRICGQVGESLKLELTAPPTEGRANEACIRFFSDFLKVPRSSVTIAAGTSNRNKIIRIAGINAIKLDQAFAAVLGTPDKKTKV
jgi:uncharacterized protein (TIGR00251 family)